MVRITAPYEEIDSRWPDTPCTLKCVVSDIDWVELRFESYVRKNKSRCDEMKIFRTRDGGNSWMEISTRLLSYWERFKYGHYWPPRPIDMCEFLGAR